MRPLAELSTAQRRKIRYVLTDFDGTLTSEGRLPAIAYQALEKLWQAGFHTVIITGGPAGMCHHMARLWPVSAVIGESGAFYFSYQHQQRKMLTRFWKSEAERLADREKLEQLKQEILQTVPAAGIASDQAYRLADLAIDVREDVAPLSNQQVEHIISLFKQAGANANVSSIHVNGWFGDYDKLSMTEMLFHEHFSVELNNVRKQVIYIGDAPNDAPMFAYFPHSIGVASIRDYASQLDAEPTWITEKRAAYGFVEVVDILLATQ